MLNCLNKYTYVWMTDGSEFWYFPTNLGANSVGGYYYDGYQWVYFTIDTQYIDAAVCS